MIVTRTLFLTVFAIFGLTGIGLAADVRGTVTHIEANGRIRISLPANTFVSTGDDVRIEAMVPGIGPVELKSRWRVKSVDEGFVLAEPLDGTSAKPREGFTAIVSSRDTSVAPATQPPDAAEAEGLSIPALTLTAEQLAATETQAEGGDALAMSLLGLYHSGRAATSDSVPRDLDEAIRWYRKAADKGDTAAMSALALIYLSRRNDSAQALNWLLQAAKSGDGTAMLQLSQVYRDGNGVAQDASRSFEWARKAAQKQESLATLELAEKYFHGNGTRQDYVEAAHWYREASEKDSALATLKLAQLYANGKGIAKDAKRSFELAKASADVGLPIGMYRLGTYYVRGEGTPKDEVGGRRWLEKAAHLGEENAMFYLCFLYDQGLGTSIDPGMAADWMIRAIRAQSVQAAEYLIRKPWEFSAAFRRELQKRLKEAGYYEGAIDGKLGPGSRRAIADLNSDSLKQ